MIHFKDDEFEVTTATTIEEAKQVLSAGFDYVTPKDGIMLFRKPKRFRCNTTIINARHIIINF